MASNTRARTGTTSLEGVGFVWYEIRDHVRADGTVYLSMLVAARDKDGSPLRDSEMDALRTQLGVQ